MTPPQNPLPLLPEPALIVVDMQNDFVHPGAPMEVAGARDILPGLGRLIAAFRAARRPVVFLRYMGNRRYDHLAEKFGWITTMAPPVRACEPGHLRRFDDGVEREGFAIVENLAPAAGEIVIDKTYYSGFHETALHARLQQTGVQSLCITGLITEMCVEDTARHAVHHGYPTVILRDLVASSDPQAAAAALGAFDKNFGWVAGSDDVVAKLQAPAAGE